MDAARHVREKARLTQALNGEERFSEVVKEITALLQKHNLDGSPELALDVFVYVLAELYLERFNPLSTTLL